MLGNLDTKDVGINKQTNKRQKTNILNRYVAACIDKKDEEK